jgi:single stranded DNA-binding protein
MKTIAIIGHIGDDARKIVMPNGETFFTFSVAVNDRYQDRKGNEINEVTWFNVTTRSEKLAQYLTRGTMVHVTGNPKISVYYSERLNESRPSIQINGASIKLLTSNNRSDNRSTAPDKPQQAQGQAAQATNTATAPQPLDDDMPF